MCGVHRTAEIVPHRLYVAGYGRKLDDIIVQMKQTKSHLKEELSSIDDISFKCVIDEGGDAGCALVMSLPAKKIVQSNYACRKHRL